MAKKEKETDKVKKERKREGQEDRVEENMNFTDEAEEDKGTVEESEETKKEPIKKSPKERRRERGWESRESIIENWIPKTYLGKEVKNGKIKKIDEIFEKNLKILEPEIVDFLIVNLEFDLIRIGQAKGKFGGGKRRPWRQTQKKTAEGNVPTFGCMAVVGDKAGHVGLGYGKAKETVPAKQKAIRNAKVNLIRIERGCGSFECTCSEGHSIPFKTEGKCGSVSIRLLPAPKGTGLAIEDECKKILKLAGIKDIYSKTFGHTKTKLNLLKACMSALKKLKKQS